MKAIQSQNWHARHIFNDGVGPFWAMSPHLSASQPRRRRSLKKAKASGGTRPMEE